MPTPTFLNLAFSQRNLIVVAIVLCLLIVVIIIVADTAIVRLETSALEIKFSIHFVLIPCQHIVAHDVPFF